MQINPTWISSKLLSGNGDTGLREFRCKSQGKLKSYCRSTPARDAANPSHKERHPSAQQKLKL